jgi:hypothetical protein
MNKYQTKKYRSNITPTRQAQRKNIPSRPLQTNTNPSRQLQTNTAPLQTNNTPGRYSASRRPTGITVVCVILGLLLAYEIVTLLRDAGKIVAWAWVSDILTLVLAVCSIVGLWLMKKWGAYAYTIGLALNLVAALILIIGAGHLLVPLLLVYLVLFTPLVILLFVIKRNFEYMR